jgi:hypothetical protein
MQCINFTCKRCGHDVYEGISYKESEYNICGACRVTEANANRLIYLKGLKALPIEDRIAKIEEWIYDYKPYIEPRY